MASYQKPPIYPGFYRYNDTSANQTSYKKRSNQYRFTSIASYFGATCDIYCGLRSFLTTDANGKLICQRDMSANFWGGLTIPYQGYCIPDVDKTLACQGLFATIQNQPNLANVGSCNMIAYANTQIYGNYSNYQCCYNDVNSGSFTPDDLTKKSIATSLYNLRNAE